MQWNSTSCCEFDKKSMETETKTWLEFPIGESHCRIYISHTCIRRKKSRVTVWNQSRKVNHWSKVAWDRKIITEFTRSISSTRIGKPVLMMDVKVSKDKNISRWVDQENLIYVRWNRIKNRAQRWRRWSIDEKKQDTEWSKASQKRK